MKIVVSLLAALLLSGCAKAPAAITPTLDPVLGAQDWINDRATRPDVAGKVVVLDVFTVDCYNCRNVVPALRQLYASQHRNGLEIIGVHTPETAAEKQRAYVTANLKEQGIVWPVAVDNAFVLWDAYGVNAWPTQLFFDRRGRLRKVIVGDSQDDAVRGEVEALLAER